jgi:uncharacterized protein YkwD
MKYLLSLFAWGFPFFFQTDLSFFEMNPNEFLAIPAIYQPIDARNPDTQLLDATVFHLSNQLRRKYHLTSLTFSPILYKIVSQHSEAMIEKNFYSHENPYSSQKRKLANRVFSQTNEFTQLAENLAENDIIYTKNNEFCYNEPSRRGGDFEFIDCDSGKPLPMQNYRELAQNIVNSWMESPPHRANLLNKNYKAMACSGRFSKKPFKTDNSPFIRITQNFGG